MWLGNQFADPTCSPFFCWEYEYGQTPPVARASRRNVSGSQKKTRRGIYGTWTSEQLRIRYLYVISYSTQHSGLCAPLVHHHHHHKDHHHKSLDPKTLKP